MAHLVSSLEAFLTVDGKPCETWQDAIRACAALNWPLDGELAAQYGLWLVTLGGSDLSELATAEHLEKEAAGCSGRIVWDSGKLGDIYQYAS